MAGSLQTKTTRSAAGKTRPTRRRDHPAARGVTQHGQISGRSWTTARTARGQTFSYFRRSATSSSPTNPRAERPLPLFAVPGGPRRFQEGYRRGRSRRTSRENLVQRRGHVYAILRSRRRRGVDAAEKPTGDEASISRSRSGATQIPRTRLSTGGHSQTPTRIRIYIYIYMYMRTTVTGSIRC